MSHRRRFAWLALSTAASCLEPTQITVELTTDMPCGAGDGHPRLLGVAIRTGTSEADLATRAETTRCLGPNDRVGSLVLVPGKGDQVYIEVSGQVAAAPGVTKELKVSRVIRYLSHTKLLLPIDLSASCLDVVCPEGKTCSRGACIDKETAGCRGDCDGGSDAASLDAATLDAPPLDAGKFDAPKDGFTADALGDAVADVVLDAGGCPQLLFPYDFYWPFNEPLGSMVVQESVTKTSSSLSQTKTGSGLGPCGNLLLLPKGWDTLKTCMGLGCWKGGQVKIGFFLRLGSGTGTVLAHNAPNAKGSWSLDVQSGPQLRFGVNYALSPTYMSAPLPNTSPIRVVATASANVMSLTIDGTPTTMVVPGMPLPSESSYEIVAGSANLDSSVDELYISSQ